MTFEAVRVVLGVVCPGLRTHLVVSVSQVFDVRLASHAVVFDVVLKSALFLVARQLTLMLMG